MRLRALLWLGLLACLAAGCATATPQTLPPAPTLQPLQVYFTPALRHWQERAANCAAGLPELGVALHEAPAESFAPAANAVFLRLGLPAGAAAWVEIYELGQEEMLLLASAANPLNSLPAGQIQAIYAGEQTHWAGTTFTQTIQLWVYPPGSDLEAAALGLASLAPAAAFLAPDPQAVLVAAAGDPAALGYVPASWWSEDTPELLRSQIKLLEADLPALPVLALSSASPNALQKEFLLCLQK